ncbi:hypothetical protein ABZ479_29905 [Streptomyces sp. NPDC005722]
MRSTAPWSTDGGLSTRVAGVSFREREGIKDVERSGSVRRGDTHILTDIRGDSAMDVLGLAGQGISLISSHLSDVAAGAVSRMGAEAADQLYEMIGERLRATRLGSAALEGLEERPHDTDWQRTATSVLAEAIEQDPEFALALRNAVESAANSRGQAHTGGSAHHQVHLDGRVDNRRGIIAGGDVDQSRRRRIIVVGGGLLAVVLAGGLGTVLLLDTGPEQAPNASVVPSVAPTMPSGDTSAASSADALTTAPTDVTWKLLATAEGDEADYYGIAIPFSASAGPRRVSGGIAAGYAHTPTGALIAGAQIGVRSGYSFGRSSWEPTITHQFVPSPDRDRLLAYLRGEATLPQPVQQGTLAQISGYIYQSYTPDTAVIGLVLRTPTARLMVTVVTLKWRGNDWRAVAPPGGVWTSVQRTLSGTVGVVPWGASS